MSNKNFVKLVTSSVSLYALVLMQIVFAPATGNFQAMAGTAAPQAIIYDNGGLASGSTSKSGVAAPAGFQWSELSTENGTNFSNTTLGAGCQTSNAATTGNRCADDFVVPAGQTWTINQVIVYGYQTNSTANPFIGASLRIWNGRPGDAGSTIIFGDVPTNRMGTVTSSGLYRIGNTLGGAGGVTAATTNTARQIWRIPINVSPGLALTSGVYWIDFGLDAGANSNFTPLQTIPGARSLPGWNARQFISTTSTWQDLLDIGEPAATAPNPQPNVVPDVPMETAFQLDGTVGGNTFAPTARSLDFDGDGRTDFAIARSADANSQTTWWIQNSGGTQIVYPLGTGVGFGTGDKATPADFDGDGKTNIAVWRGGASPSAGFYFLTNSNTVSFVQFGQTGDDPSIVDDFDGDGIADPAVYRASNSTFYYRGSSSNPNGNVTFVPFGKAGDIALPGDMNGDGKADFNIVRNNAGLAEHWSLLSGGGTRTFQYGLATDKFVTGDFDADNRTDICAVRANGSVYDWYALRSATNSILFVQWGNPATDYLTPGDYDGDAKTDFVVWRSGQAADQTFFYVKGTGSATATREWGQSAGANTAPDYPVANWNVK
jgi:hypothetical protein